MSYQQEIGLIAITAIIFTVSFLWKDLFNDIVNVYFPSNSGFLSRTILTIVITCILLFSLVYLRKSTLSQSKQPLLFDTDPIN